MADHAYHLIEQRHSERIDRSLWLVVFVLLAITLVGMFAWF